MCLYRASRISHVSLDTHRSRYVDDAADVARRALQAFGGQLNGHMHQAVLRDLLE